MFIVSNIGKIYTDVTVLFFFPFLNLNQVISRQTDNNSCQNLKCQIKSLIRILAVKIDIMDSGSTLKEPPFSSA